MPVTPYIVLFGSCLLHGRENQWEASWRSCGRFECEFGHLWNVHHSSRNGSSRKRLWHKFNIYEVLPLEKQIFMKIKKLISCQTETTGIGLKWVPTNLLHSRDYQYSTAKVFVFSDVVLCLGKMKGNFVESWKKQIQ